MMRSLYSGVSGLRNHQTRMDVIGNNIANVNTAGFKKSRVVFKDTLYQTVRGAASPVAGAQGGTNPMGIGLGMTVGSIDQIHTGAPITTTNKLTDMAVDGNGYFIVNKGGQRYYTRAGAFDFDVNGNLVSLTNGYNVQGWNAAPPTFALTTTADPTTINIANYKDLDARPTANMVLSGNLDSATGFTTSRDEWQTLTFPTIPVGGAVGEQFTLTVGAGNTTAPIAIGADGVATAANIQAQLGALPNVGNGNVAVTWDAVRQRYDIKFQNVLKQKDMPAITYAPAIIPGAGAGVTETTPGSPAPATNEVQTLSLGVPAPIQGTYTLSYNGVNSTAIAYNATAAAVQTALRTIPALTMGANVSVAGAPGGPYTITFGNALAATEVPMIGFNSTLTGGTAAAATLYEGQAPLDVVKVNEVQTLNLTTALTSATTFTLTYPGGPATAPIAFDATAATIQAALIAANTTALTNNVTVTQTTAPVAGLSGGAFTVNFNNVLAGTNIPQMGLNTAGLAPGTGSISTTTQGKPADNPLPADVKTFSKDVYDSQGNKVSVNYRFFKYEITPGSNPGVLPVVQPVTRWACDISFDPLFEGQAGYNANADLRAIEMNGAAPPAAGNEKMTRIYNIQFDQNGSIVQPNTSNIPLSINRQVPLPGSGTANLSIKVDFQKLSQIAASSSAWAESQDGYGAGKLTSYSIGVDGIITGVYDNGEKKSLAQIALRNFENPGGMQQLGGTLFQETVNSGALPIDTPGKNGLGKISPSSLEMSNVDLSEEFTDMIITQRGFQANSRIITTSDEMLQELVNLKR